MFSLIFNSHLFLKNNFTVGIEDDMTHLNLKIESNIHIEAANFEALFYENKSI